MDLLRPLLATLLSLAPVAALGLEGASLGGLALVGWVTLVQVSFASVATREGRALVQLAAALPSFGVAAALDVAAGAEPAAVALRAAGALAAVALLSQAGAGRRSPRAELVHGAAVCAFVVLAPALEIAFEVSGVRGAGAGWFEACVAAGPLGFAWSTLALDADVAWARALASLAAPGLVFVGVQLAREREPRP